MANEIKDAFLFYSRKAPDRIYGITEELSMSNYNSLDKRIISLHGIPFSNISSL